MGEYISGGINFAGLGSGTDFTTMIEQLKKIEEIPKNRLTSWKADWQARVDAFNEILGVMKTSQAALSEINKLSTFLTKTASSSREGAVGISANGEASDGQHSIWVDQLASSGIINSTKNFDSKNHVVNNTTETQYFVFTYGEDKTPKPEEPDPSVPVDPDAPAPAPTVPTNKHTIEVPPGASIDYLMNKVNSLNKGVTASLIPSGAGFIFQVQGKESGEINKLTIDDDTTLDDFKENVEEIKDASGNITQEAKSNWHVREAQDAIYTIDNNPSAFKSTTNTISNVIKGVTFTLKAKVSKDDPVTITISNDTTKLKENIKTFVDSTNEVLAKIKELTKYDKNKSTEDKSTSLYSTQKGAILTGNYGVQLLASRLKEVNATKGIGFNPQDENGVGDTFALLGQLGINIVASEKDANFGLLGIDEKKLDEAIAKDAYSVAQIFAADMQTSTSSNDFRYVSHLDQMTKAGNYDVSYRADGEGKIFEVYIGGVLAQQSEDDPNQFTAGSGPAKGLSIAFDPYKVFDSTVDYSAQIGMKQGKVGQWTDMLAAEQNNNITDRGTMGALPLLIDNYTNGIIKNLDAKIERETTRIMNWETRQRLLFSRLDTVLQGYSSQMEANSAALGQLGGSSSSSSSKK